MPTEASDKGPIRKEMRRLLDSLGKEFKENGSASIVSQLAHILPAHATCAIFHGTRREPDVSSLFQVRPDLSLAYPRIIAPGVMAFYHTPCLTALSEGSFGILEPDPSFLLVSPHEIDTILCPGLAFTQEGHRLGQGGGFYDRYLPEVSHAHIIGIAFAEQIQESLPVEDHDISMGDVIIPKESPPKVLES